MTLTRGEYYKMRDNSPLPKGPKGGTPLNENRDKRADALRRARRTGRFVSEQMLEDLREYCRVRDGKEDESTDQKKLRKAYETRRKTGKRY